MKAKIVYSRYATIVTALIFGVLFVCTVASVHQKAVFWVLIPVYLLMVLTGMLCGAAYIRINPDYVILGSLLKSKKIPVGNIESVELFQPTMGAVRIFGSGGFWGYWGLFREGDIGRYYAFYGKASDCFLLRMKNGDKYVLGCENPSAAVSYIRSLIRESGR